MVLHMMDLASRIIDLDFNEDQIDGGVEGVCVSREEDMLVSMCYTAECLAFGKAVDMEIFTVHEERGRVLDSLFNLLDFE